MKVEVKPSVHAADETASFRASAQSKERGGVRVSVCVPDEKESRRTLSVSPYRHRIQPVWLEIENGGSLPCLFLKRNVDADYYSAEEAAFMCHFATFRRIFAYGIFTLLFPHLLILAVIDIVRARIRNRRMDKAFRQKEIVNEVIAPGKTLSGLVYTPLSEGRKAVDVLLMGGDENRRFHFVFDLPGVRPDYLKRPFEDLFTEKEIESLPAAKLGEWLEKAPRATVNKKGTKEGDPMNLVLVGDFDILRRAFFTAKWDETESMYLGSALRTAKSTFFGSEYRLSPVSSLYVFDRPQDVAFQKARSTIHQRHHLRLWYTPKRFDGKPVWVGQASRDIGVRFTLKTLHLTTHKIDPDVDDERDYVLGDLLDTGKVSHVGYVEGVGRSEPRRPRKNLTGDPYFTDGRRGLLVLSEKPTEPHFFSSRGGSVSDTPGKKAERK